MRLLLCVAFLSVGCAYQQHASWYIHGHGVEAQRKLGELAQTIAPATLQAKKVEELSWHLGRQARWSDELKRDTGAPEGTPTIPTGETTPEAALEDRKLVEYGKDIDRVPRIPFGQAAGGFLALLGGGGGLTLAGIAGHLIRRTLRKHRDKASQALSMRDAAQTVSAKRQADAMAMVDLLDKIKSQAPQAVKDVAKLDPTAQRLYNERKIQKAEDAERMLPIT